MTSEKINLTAATLRVGGMTCANCEEAIRRKLCGAQGVESAEVNYNKSSAVVKYDAAKITLDDICAMIKDAGYDVIGGAVGAARPKTDIQRTLGMIMIIVAIYIVLQTFGLLNYLAPSMLADENMSIWLLFVVGLTTSIHCIAMCGGINLSQCLRKNEKNGNNNLTTVGGKLSALRPPVLYNLGRVISYTAIGGAVGAVGAAIGAVTPTAQGALKLIAGVFMVMMGITMLDLFPGLRKFIPRMPKFFANKINSGTSKSKGPLIVGLLNGFMPCGPLQMAQLYALTTGSAASGALAMLLFSLGTVPLMFGLGTFGTVAGKSSRKIMAAGAVAVAVLGLSMLSQSWHLFGINISSPASMSSKSDAADELKINIDLGPQIINSTLQSFAYPSIRVEPNRPVRWIIDAPPGSINGCNNRFIIREYGIEHRFTPGENVIEFTPTREGRIPYACWMGMITATITVARGTTPGNESDPVVSPQDRPRCC